MTAPAESRARESAVYRRYLSDLRSLPTRPHLPSGTREEGRGELVESNLFYVVHVAREYSDFGILFEDLLSEGNVGLLEAAERFDPKRGTKFITYASWWIRKRMLNLIARQLTFIRLPKYKVERLRRLRAAEAALGSRLCRRPQLEELASETGLSPLEIENLRLIGQRQVSLEHLVNGECGRRLEELLSEPAGAEAEEGLIEQDFENHLAKIIDELPEKERFVVRQRFGFDGDCSSTLQSIAGQLGLSRERVRQIELQALERIRRALSSRSSAFSCERSPAARAPEGGSLQQEKPQQSTPTAPIVASSTVATSRRRPPRSSPAALPP